MAIAVHYDAETLPRLAAFFYRQAVEERNHAMMIVRYLLDADHEVQIPGVACARGRLLRCGRAHLPGDSPRRSGSPSRSARSPPRPANEGDYQGEQFMQWFIKEQVEEVATMSDMLRVVEMGKDNLLAVEEYLARESIGDDGGDPTAPDAAGGAL